MGSPLSHDEGTGRCKGKTRERRTHRSQIESHSQKVCGIRGLRFHFQKRHCFLDSLEGLADVHAAPVAPAENANMNLGCWCSPRMSQAQQWPICRTHVCNIMLRPDLALNRTADSAAKTILNVAGGAGHPAGSSATATPVPSAGSPRAHGATGSGVTGPQKFGCKLSGYLDQSSTMGGGVCGSQKPIVSGVHEQVAQVQKRLQALCTRGGCMQFIYIFMLC